MGTLKKSDTIKTDKTSTSAMKKKDQDVVFKKVSSDELSKRRVSVYPYIL